MTNSQFRQCDLRLTAWSAFSVRRFLSTPRDGFCTRIASALDPAVSSAGGPKYVAGVSFFNPGVVGLPVRWAGGQVKYSVDLAR